MKKQLITLTTLATLAACGIERPSGPAFTGEAISSDGYATSSTTSPDSDTTIRVPYVYVRSVSDDGTDASAPVWGFVTITFGADAGYSTTSTVTMDTDKGTRSFTAEGLLLSSITGDAQANGEFNELEIEQWDANGKTGVHNLVLEGNPIADGVYPREYGYFISGYDTDPADVQARSDTSAQYVGTSDGWLTIHPDDGYQSGPGLRQAEASLDSSFDVNFDTGMISGLITAGVIRPGWPSRQTDFPDGNLILLLGDTPITGNGFIGTLSIDDASTLSIDKSGTLEILGQFYEDDAAALAGIFGGTLVLPDRANTIDGGTYGDIDLHVTGGFMAEEDLTP